MQDIFFGTNSPLKDMQPISQRTLAVFNALGAAIIHDAVYIESKQ